ncbi:HNH endonuclease [Zhengella sp. ZM62]|uniref:HNH endonuclease n=1 Tax=Zhengella sedimenti TaxID=3390035 RepID=UPI0039759E86
MTRSEFPAKVRKSVFARANGKCEKCAAALKTGEGEIDHILPCALGGEPTIANARLLCRVCHVEKTGDDVRRVRKADRQKAKQTGASRPKGKLKSRGFEPTEKPRKIDKSALPPRRLFEQKEAR